MGLLSTIGAASGRAFGLTRVGAVIRDAYFNLVTLLLPGNGTNGAQNNTFLDSSSNNFTITRNGNTTQGTFSPFSQTGWSNYFDGTSDYLTAVGSNLALGTGDFTIEFWFYANAYSITTDSSAMFDSRSGNNTTGFQIGPVFNAVDKLTVGQNTSPIITSSTTYPLNTWVHCAVVRSSGTIVLYQNGVNVGSVANTTNNSTTTNYIGSGHWQPTAAGATFNGYLSNFRISNTARYTSGFTPPTTPFSSDANTRLLACQSNRFADSSSNGYAVTPFGTPSVQAFSPFAPTAAYDAAVVGASGYFDGSGDYLRTPSITIGTNAFCFECWFYPTASQPILAGFFAATTNNALQLSYTNTGAGLGIAQRGVAFRVTGSSIPVVNQWNHIAFVRSGTGSNQTSIFLNGVRIANGTASDNFSASAYDIAYNSGDNAYLTGYISGARLTNGSTPYDATLSTLTIPTAPPTTSASNTVLLLNFTNAGITDATAKNVLETVGNAQISTTQSKFGGSSMYFDGTGDYLLAPSSQNFAFPSDFTVEFWLYLTAVSGEGTTFYVPTTGGMNLFMSISSNWGIARSGVAVDNNFGTPPTQNVWHHIAVSRSGSTINAYIDGTRVFTGTNTVNYAAGTLQVGLSSFGTITGYIDDLRVTKFARYTGSTLTVPTAAFPLQ